MVAKGNEKLFGEGTPLTTRGNLILGIWSLPPKDADLLSQATEWKQALYDDSCSHTDRKWE